MYMAKIVGFSVFILKQFHTNQIIGPGTCDDYVANNATAFTDAYWQFNNFTVYQAS